jgi:hypothetical protein
MRRAIIFKPSFIVGSLLVACLLTVNSVRPQGAVTYLDKAHWGGRLGDMLMMYIKAKWVAFEYKLPLLYKPFDYSDQLAMHVREQHYADHITSGDKKQLITCYDRSDIIQHQTLCKDFTLYQVHYYFHPPEWGHYQAKYDSQEIMAWAGVLTNTAFRNELKKNIAPRNPIQLQNLPTDKITVAVHIRNGGGFDDPILSRQLYTFEDLNPQEPKVGGTFADRYWPFKFPPLQYYIDQIKRLSELCHDAPMYLYIYTDHNNPVFVMNIIKAVVDKPNIIFVCREHDNHHAKNVLEDIFAMAQYDCLIRSGSNYPQISQMIGNHKVVIWPKACKWIGNTLVIDDVGVFVAD